MTRQQNTVKKQVIGIIQQHNRYITSTSNLEGLKDLKNTHAFGWLFCWLPRGLRREICSTCSWDQVCSHHCRFAGRVFNLDFFGKERLHKNPLFFGEKGDLLEEKHLGFLKNPHVFEEKNSVVCWFSSDGAHVWLNYVLHHEKPWVNSATKQLARKEAPQLELLGFSMGFFLFRKLTISVFPGASNEPTSDTRCLHHHPTQGERLRDSKHSPTLGVAGSPVGDGAEM